MPIFTIPNVDLYEANHCHGSGKGHPCAGGQTPHSFMTMSPRDRDHFLRSKVRTLTEPELKELARIIRGEIRADPNPGRKSDADVIGAATSRYAQWRRRQSKRNTWMKKIEARRQG